MKVDDITDSSLRQYVVIKGGEIINTCLEKKLIRSIEVVHDKLKFFVGQDVLQDNSAKLEVCCTEATKLGISNDFYIKGRTGYTSLFYNFDASTLDTHTEMDWSMTTIYVPNQEWTNKDISHLMFVFDLTKKVDGILKISMQPGSIIYFHGWLLTHHQMHADGKVTKKGCCLNLSAYANRRLLCHFIKSAN